MARKKRDRDWLAMKAMPACIAIAAAATAAERIAERAYAIADAMIEEGKKELDENPPEASKVAEALGISSDDLAAKPKKRKGK
jgi:hypothetical protein